jgi:hypothetical protein
VASGKLIQQPWLLAAVAAVCVVGAAFFIGTCSAKVVRSKSYDAFYVAVAFDYKVCCQLSPTTVLLFDGPAD